MSDSFAIVRTHHSYHEGTGVVKKYVAKAVESGIKNLVMADRTVMSDAINFYKACKSADINPIMGLLLSLYDEAEVMAYQRSANKTAFEVIEKLYNCCFAGGFSESVLSGYFKDLESGFISPMVEKSFAKPKAALSEHKSAFSLLSGFLSVFSRDDLIQELALFVDSLSKDNTRAERSSLTIFGGVIDQTCEHPFNELYNLALIENSLAGLCNDGSLFYQMDDVSLAVKSVSEMYIESNNAKKSKKIETIESFLKRVHSPVSTVLEMMSSDLANLDDKKASDVSKLVRELKKVEKVGASAKELVTKEFLNWFSTLPVDSLKRIASATDYNYLNNLANCDYSSNDLFKLGDNYDYPSLSLVADIYENFKYLTFNNFMAKVRDDLSCEYSRSCMALMLCLKSQHIFSRYVEKTDDVYPDVTVFANNQQGWRNLIMLSSSAFVFGQKKGMITLDKDKRKIDSYPKVTLSDLETYKDGLCVVLGLEGDPLWKAIMSGQDVDPVITKFKGLFGDNVFVAIQHSNTKVDGQRYLDEAFVNQALINLSIKHSIIPFAANNAFFVDEDDYDIHDAKSAELLGELIQSKCRNKRYGHGNYLKSLDEMALAFSDTPELLNNTAKLMPKIGVNGEHLFIELDVPVLPEFPIPDGFTQTEWISHLAHEGVELKFGRRCARLFGSSSPDDMPPENLSAYHELRAEYFDRLSTELGIIDGMGFNGYFLIVAEFITWSKNNGVPVGHGRGSGAGSIVAWGLDITDVDPIRYSLLFERFLNPERVSMPDFDVDFGSGFHPETGEFMDRDRVIKHTQDLYNNPDNIFPSVGQIATHGLLSPKSAFKAFSRTTNKSVRYADDFCKLVGDDPQRQKISCCMENESILYRMSREPYIDELVKLATKAEGLKQNSGMHAGGVCIAKGSLTDHTPIMIDIREPTKIVAQFDKYGVEEGGLVKFDFLGLFYLTIMEYAKKYIKDFRGENIDLRELCYEDPKVFDLLKDGNSQGIFQVESEGMRKLLQRLMCDDMEELSALLALYRPGPLQSGMVDNFIARKHGREEVSYPHPKYQHELLKPILAPTYGVILYQEQVMQIAQALAGYSLGGADMLRRAMGKKKPEEMAKQRSVFEEGAKAKGVDPELAIQIFELVEKFAGYGFNKSHSMAYAHITYQTAWFKTYYPTEYMCALLTSFSANQDRLKPTLLDCKRNGITVLPPDINASHADFQPVKDGYISYGLGAIKGISEAKLKPIIAEREANGPFKSILDLKLRCPVDFSKSVAEGLRFSGALDNLGTIKELPDDALRPLCDVMGGTMATRDITVKEAGLSQHQQDVNKAVCRGLEIKEFIVSLLNYYDSSTSFELSESPLSVNTQNQLVFGEAANLTAYITELLETGALDQDELENHSTRLRQIQRGVAERDALASKFKSAFAEAKETSKQVDELVKNRLDELKATDQRAMFDKRAFLEKECDCVFGNTKPVLQFYHDNFQTIDELSCDEKLCEEAASYSGKGVDVTELSTEDAKKHEYLIGCNKVVKNANFRKALRIHNSISYEGVARYSDAFRLEREVGYLTYFVTGHLFDVDNMRNLLLKHFKNVPVAYIEAPQFENEDLDDDLEVEKAQQRNRRIRSGTPQTRVAGIITDCRIFKVRKEGSKLQGRDMAAFTLDDSTASMTIVVLPDAFDSVKGTVKNGQPFAAEGQVFYDTYRDDGSISMLPDKIYNAVNINDVLYENVRNQRGGRR